MRREPESIRCRAMTFHKRRCRNQVMTVDPLYCHRHSKDHAYRRCISTHVRNNRPCLRKTVEGSAFCANHVPLPTGMQSHRAQSVFHA